MDRSNQTQVVFSSAERIPSLDGLRAISIGLVLVAHLAGTRNSHIPHSFGQVLGLGQLGVRFFFVISGFLITNLLLRESAVKDRINLWRFYFRRTLRIMPPYYAFVVCLILAEASGVVLLAPSDKLHALTYTSNYYSGRSWFMGHTWSLAVEEQFYLLWPATLVILGKRKALYAAALFVLVSPLIRIAIWSTHPYPAELVGFTFETIGDAIAVGCVLAGMRPWLIEQTWYHRFLKSPLFIAVPIFMFSANLLNGRPRLFLLVGYTVMNVGIALCLDWCVTFYTGRVGRILNSRPLVFIGVMSYSIYLWQQVFLNRYSSSVTSSFPVNLMLVSILALSSYYLIERPCLRSRQFLEAKLFNRRSDKFPIQKSECERAGNL